MNFSKKLILAGLAVSLLALPACEHHGRHRRPGGGVGGGKGLAGGCGGAPCGQGPGAGNKYGRMDRTFEVYIYTDPQDSSKCYADVDVATLWKEKNGHPKQNVSWFSDDGKPYIVDFRPGTHHMSPFTNNPQNWFQVPAGKSVSSDTLDPEKPSGYYEFAILPGTDPNDPKVTPCKDASDPGYYVKP